MDPVRWRSRPELRDPVLVAAFEGWNDAGEAATTAVRHLAEAWGAEAFADVDPEEFHDFTESRPTVRIVGGLTRHLEWPAHELSAARLADGPSDVVFLQAVEPQLRWRTYTGALVDVAQQLGCRMVVSLGALLADTPHTRPVRVTGTTADPELAQRLGLVRSRYEGPTGIVGVLHDALSGIGIPSASLWASVPHYVGRNPSPPAALALVERTAALLGAAVETDELREAAAEYLAEVDDVVHSDEEAEAYVRSLEDADDEPELDAGRLLGEVRRPEDEGVSIAGADELAAEVERFLRDHREGR